MMQRIVVSDESFAPLNMKWEKYIGWKEADALEDFHRRYSWYTPPWYLVLPGEIDFPMAYEVEA